jgi:hypothetical protein
MPLLSTDDQATFDRLKIELENARPVFDLADRYYAGQQYLEQLGLAIPPNLTRFTVITNWPRVVVDARADRLDVKGFRMSRDSDTGDAELWDLWQANDLDELDLMARLDYQLYGRSYHCIGVNEQDAAHPLITVESPRQIITDRDARSGKLLSALRLYDPKDGRDTRATLYLPNSTTWLAYDEQGQWALDGDRNQHDLGVVPVVPSFRARRSTIPAWMITTPLQGTSAMDDVIPLTDAAARNLTNAQIAQETHAVPQRWVVGASKGDFVDKDGAQLPVWASYFGAIWASGNKDAKVGQLDASSMSNFETMMTLYAKMASGVSGLPPDYFGLTANEAASADAIRSRESRFVKSVERDQVALGNSRKSVLKIALKIRDGDAAADMTGMECLWYDAGTPTYASRVDAVVKQYAATDPSGRSLLPAEMAWEELGWSPPKIARAKELRASEAIDPYLAATMQKDAATGVARAARDAASMQPALPGL